MQNIRGLLHPEKLPPLQLTSKPIEDDSLVLPNSGMDEFALEVSRAESERQIFAREITTVAAYVEADCEQRL